MLEVLYLEALEAKLDSTRHAKLQRFVFKKSSFRFNGSIFREKYNRYDTT